MKDRPILFSAPMVRALLGGSKTQTRRVLKQATGPSLSVGIEDEPGVAELSWLSGDGPGHDVHETIKKVRCPYGVPGDRLWVRETHAKIIGQSGGWIETDYFATYKHGDRLGDKLGFKKALDAINPHAARRSRIDLEVTGVRVERLQEISRADAQADGAPPSHPSIDRISREFGYEDFSRFWYAQLWEQLNGPGSWAANPWVWIVEFRRVRP